MDRASLLGLGVYIDRWPTFAPVGDIYGCFIVVQEERVWLPTDDLAAAVFPTEVLLAGSEAELEFAGVPYRIRQVA